MDDNKRHTERIAALNEENRELEKEKYEIDARKR